MVIVDDYYDIIINIICAFPEKFLGRGGQHPLEEEEGAMLASLHSKKNPKSFKSIGFHSTTLLVCRGSSVSRSAFFIKFTKACLFLSGADEMLQISPETTGLTLCTGIYNSRLHTFVRKACAQVGVLHKHTQTHARFTLFFREPLKTLFWKIHRE